MPVLDILGARDIRLKLLPPRVIWLLLGFALVVVGVSVGNVVYDMWRANAARAEKKPAAKKPPEVLDFATVKERYPKVRQGMSQVQLEALLGKPTRCYGPNEFAERAATKDEFLAALPQPGDHRARHLWHLWIDPADDRRRIVVVYFSYSGHKYLAESIRKQGF